MACTFSPHPAPAASFWLAHVSMYLAPRGTHTPAITRHEHTPQAQPRAQPRTYGAVPKMHTARYPKCEGRRALVCARTEQWRRWVRGREGPMRNQRRGRSGATHSWKASIGGIPRDSACAPMTSQILTHRAR